MWTTTGASPTSPSRSLWATWQHFIWPASTTGPRLFNYCWKPEQVLLSSLFLPPTKLVSFSILNIYLQSCSVYKSTFADVGLKDDLGRSALHCLCASESEKSIFEAFKMIKERWEDLATMLCRYIIISMMHVHACPCMQLVVSHAKLHVCSNSMFT